MACPAEAARGKRAQGRALAEGSSPRSGSCSTPPFPTAPATNFGSATSRARRACSRSSSRARRRTANRVRRQPRTVRHRLQLGRLRKPRAAGRSAPHRSRSRRRQSGSAAHRARGSGRPDRGPRRRRSIRRAAPVDVAGLAVAANEEFLVVADCGRAADLPRVAPDHLCVMADMLDVARTAVVREDARPIVVLLGGPKMRPWLRAKRRAACPPTDSRPRGCLPGSSGECSKRPVAASSLAQTRASAASAGFQPAAGHRAAARSALCAASRRWLKSARRVVPPDQQRAAQQQGDSGRIAVFRQHASASFEARAYGR